MRCILLLARLGPEIASAAAPPKISFGVPCAHDRSAELKSIETMGAGKSCGAPKMCDIDAKPVPKGSIPGVAW